MIYDQKINWQDPSKGMGVVGSTRGCRRTIRLTPSGRLVSQIFWKMMAPLKPLNESLVTPTAERQSCMTPRPEGPLGGHGADSVLMLSLTNSVNE
jgi:hypothetical protein